MSLRIDGRTNSVAIFGGGIAGLTAAHELSERGFRVTIYDPRTVLGGKARSMDVPGSSRGGRKPLPAEHGFRLFPGFYRHVPDTMSRIPYRANRNGVLDNLVSVDRTLFASAGQRPLRFPVHTPRTRIDVASWAAALIDATEAWVPAVDNLFFAQRMLVLLTSCDRRRESEFDEISWWDYMNARSRSANYRRYLAGGLTRSLVAMKAEDGCARTLGLILQALMLDTLTPGRSSDRVLNGPTNPAWIDPWIAHLKRLGVRFRSGTLSRLLLSDGRVKGALVSAGGGKARPVTATEFVVAVPHEALHHIVTDDVRDAAPSLRSLHKLRSEWMNGIQYYLRRDVPLVDGHCIFVDSPWALTAISQRQFWTGVDLQDYGDGRTRGILSVDISDWNTPGVLFGRPARRCSSEEIGREVWAQLELHLNGKGRQELADDDVVRCFLDPSIVFETPKRPFNTEPLFVNTVGSWKSRPQVQTEIENLCVAGDFVRTHTDLATMEAANESGRLAAAAILERAGAHYSLPHVWRLPEPEGLAPLKALDARRFERGEPHEWYDGKANSFGEIFTHRLSQVRRQLAHAVRSPACNESAQLQSAASVEVGRRQSTNRSDALFTSNPTEASTVIGEKRTRVPLPFHAYEADALVIYGTASVTAMRTILAGTALHPVQGGADFGYAMLWIIRYSDTSCGPYSEVVVNFVACRRPRALEFRNDYSIVAAMLDAENVLFTPQLLLDRQLPIDYGREIYGLDKRPAEIEIEKSGPAKRFVCRSEKGDIIIAGNVQEENRPAEQCLALLELKQNLGLRRITGDFWRVLRGEPSTGVLVTRDVRREHAVVLSEIVGTYKFAPSFTRWSPRDDLLVHDSAPFGSLVRQLRFSPRVYGCDPNMKSVLRAASSYGYPETGKVEIERDRASSA